jgi:hypothetical protein
MPVPMKRPRAFKQGPDDTIDLFVATVFDWWMADEDTRLDAFAELRRRLYHAAQLPPPRVPGPVIETILAGETRRARGRS